MDVITPSPAVDFNFDSGSTSPYMSAPTSPARLSAFYHAAAALSAVPFGWEEKPGIPKGHVYNSSAASSNYGDAEEELLDDNDFAFDFCGQLERDYLPADELFDGGKIKPLKPPPRLQYDQTKPVVDNNSSPKSPRSPTQIIREAFSKSKDFDPFTAALEQTRRETVRQNVKEKRGRERTTRCRNSRSLSPYRVSDLLLEPDPVQSPTKTPSRNSQFSSSSFSSFWYKKWKIKDLLLFRSASESRAKDKEEEMKKYDLLRKPGPGDDTKTSSFRSTESVGSGSSMRKSGPSISAHELHYTVNRQFSEEMKKRTLLPYKQGLLGCLGFHPTVHDISSKGVSPTGSLSRG